jgi:membrane protease YdiL (CAAX protease family)
MDTLGELWSIVWAWLGLAIGGGVVCAALWLTWRPRPLLAPQRRRAVPWSGLQVVLAFALYLFWPAVVGDLVSQLAELDEAPDFVWWLLEDQNRGARQAVALTLAFPFQLATILFVLWRLSGTRPYQLGLTTHRLRANTVLAYLAFVALVPAVYAVDLATDTIYEELAGRPPTPHELTKLIRDQYPALEWALLWFLAVIHAPVLEELLFRGILQGWLVARRWGGHLMMGLVLLLPGLSRVLAQRSPDLDLDLFWQERLLFAVALLPGYLALPEVLHWWSSRPTGARGPAAQPAVPPLDSSTPLPDLSLPDEVEPGPWWLRSILLALDRAWDDPPARPARAVYGTAALFAYVHPWPTPVPLFLLGLGLGWLAYRTQSLVGPMVLHALFNSVACLSQWQTR